MDLTIKSKTHYSCTKCDQKFKLHHRFRHHLNRFHHPRNEKIFTCEQCNNRFANKHAWKLHMRTEHASEIWKCKLCNKTCQNSRALNAHTRQVHGAKQKVVAVGIKVEEKKKENVGVYIGGSPLMENESMNENVAANTVNVNETGTEHVGLHKNESKKKDTKKDGPSCENAGVPTGGGGLIENKSMNDNVAANVHESDAADVELHKKSKEMIKDPLKQQGRIIFSRPWEDPNYKL